MAGYNLDAFNGVGSGNNFGSLSSYGAGSLAQDNPFGLQNYGFSNSAQNLGNQFDALKANQGTIGSAQNTLGANIPTFQLGLAGVGALGNLWGAFQSNKLANDQFNYTKQITDTNLANQIKTYNTALSDRANARGAMEGWTDQQKQDYVSKNQLSR